MIWRRFTFALLIAALGLSFSSSLYADWPQWRGPNRDAISKEKGLLNQWKEGGPPLSWRTRGLGNGYASVAIADKRIITMGSKRGGTFVIALDVKNGNELWATKIGSGGAIFTDSNMIQSSRNERCGLDRKRRQIKSRKSIRRGERDGNKKRGEINDLAKSRPCPRSYRSELRASGSRTPYPLPELHRGLLAALRSLEKVCIGGREMSTNSTGATVGSDVGGGATAGTGESELSAQARSKHIRQDTAISRVISWASSDRYARRSRRLSEAIRRAP